MPISDAFVQELTHETALTRTLLSAIPEAHSGWKPHPKSFSLGDLALHLAMMAKWGAMTVQLPEFDFAPLGDQPAMKWPTFTAMADTIPLFDQNNAEFVAVLAAASDADLLTPWTLKKAGVTLFTMPRVAVLRGMVFNHVVHHRGQLTVYLRLLDIPLSQVYGPTADFPTM